MKDIQESINTIVEYTQPVIIDTCKCNYSVEDAILKDSVLHIKATITPVNALRQIEVTMPWYWSYRSLNKMHQFFTKRAFVSFNKTQNIYDFPMALWNNDIEEYVYKERFNNAKYKMKK